MHKHTFWAHFVRMVGLAAILGIFALASTLTAFASGPTLNVNVVGSQQIVTMPDQKPISMDIVSGTQNVDMFTVDDGTIWLRLGDGTVSYHPAIGTGERWIPYWGVDYSRSTGIGLGGIYSLPKVTWKQENTIWGTKVLRVVEEPVEFDFAAGAGNFASAQGDLNWTTRPQFLTDVNTPNDRTDLLIYGIGGTCKARLNGSEEILDVNTDMPILSGGFTVTNGECGVYSKDNLALDAYGTKRSFSGRYLQANVGGLTAILFGLLAVAWIVNRRKRFAHVLVWAKKDWQIRLFCLWVIAVLLGSLSLVTGTANAGPQPGATPTPVVPAATEVPAEVTPTPETGSTPTPEVAPTEVPPETLRTLNGAHLNEEGHLILEWSFGEIQDLGLVTGPQGDIGPAGPAGANGVDGAPGPQGPQGEVGPQGDGSADGTSNWIILTMFLAMFFGLLGTVGSGFVIYLWLSGHLLEHEHDEFNHSHPLMPHKHSWDVDQTVEPAPEAPEALPEPESNPFRPNPSIRRNKIEPPAA